MSPTPNIVWHDVLHLHVHIRAYKVKQQLLTSMCGHWIVMVITVTT